MQPGDNECLLFEDSDWNGNVYRVNMDPGRCDKTNIGSSQWPYFWEYHPSTTTHIHVPHWFNDRATSWACGKNVVFDFCNNSNWDQDCYHGNGVHGSGPARSAYLEINDSVSSVWMSCRNTAYAPAILFEHGDCRGRAVRIDLVDDPNGGRQARNMEWLHWAGMPNDWLSSVMVPPGYKLTLF